jgi:hypothetical protein
MPAKLSETKPDDILVAGSRFACLEAGARREVKRHDKGDLYIDCAFGEHYLCDNLDVADCDTLVGLERPLTATDALDALRLILPLAKAYAATHPVGSNAEYVAAAEAAIARAGA